MWINNLLLPLLTTNITQGLLESGKGYTDSNESQQRTKQCITSSEVPFGHSTEKKKYKIHCSCILMAAQNHSKWNLVVTNLHITPVKLIQYGLLVRLIGFQQD